MQQIKLIIKYYSKGIIASYLILMLLNLPEFNFVILSEQSFLFGIGIALFLNAWDSNIYK